MDEVRWRLFGDKLRVARALSGMSLRDVGARVGVSAMAISKYENGTCTPKSSVLVAIAKLYGVQVGWLMCSCKITLGWHGGGCADATPRTTMDTAN